MRRTPLAVAAAVVVMTVAACGNGNDSATPNGVRSVLSQVDAAVQTHDYGRARTDLDALVASTIAARDHAQISASQAKDILAAAAQLRADLPQPAPSPLPAVQPTQTIPGNSGDKKDGPGGDNGHKSRKGPPDRHGK